MTRLCRHGHDTEICGRKPNRTCRECHRIASREYYQRPANKERHRLWLLKYNRSAAGRSSAARYARTSQGRDRTLARTRAWQKRNPEKVRLNKVICSARRRARKRGAAIEQCRPIYLRAAWWRSVGFPVEVDHKVPLAKGGAHSPENLQIIYATDNVAKGVKLDFTPSVVFH